MVELTIKIKQWKICIVADVWNKPPKNPIPLSRYVKYKLFKAKKHDIIKIVIVTREYKIDLSRLIVIALDNNK